MKYCAVKPCGFNDKLCDRNCALQSVEHMLAVTHQSLNVLYIRYSCATPMLAVTGDRWR